MPSFVNFNDRLPDPTFGVSAAGTVDVTGAKGPGFASVSVTSHRPVQSSRTISGRGVQAESGAQFWEININYHPMPRDNFDVVSAFLDARNGKLNPFFVVLPQYSRPKNAAFATFVETRAISVVGAHAAGSNTILVSAPVPFTAYPSFNDFFTITDGMDINHKKAYKVTRIETNALYQGNKAQPTTSQVRLHIMPPLVRSVGNGSGLNFINPLFRVIQKADVLEYSLDTNNLYQFQLSLEEIQI